MSMNGNVERKECCLVVVESGELTVYPLDDKAVWEVGRSAQDIRLRAPLASRTHGKFKNNGGSWFYIDAFGKNGTSCNTKPIKPGLGGRVRPVLLKDGDVLIFGTRQGQPTAKTAWALFSERPCAAHWDRIDTSGCQSVSVTDGVCLPKNLQPGDVAQMTDGIAVCMGEVTYTAGHVQILKNDG